jgi:hypothetical protein
MYVLGRIRKVVPEALTGEKRNFYWVFMGTTEKRRSL